MFGGNNGGSNNNNNNNRKLCNYYNTPQGCKNGNQCSFRHERVNNNNNNNNGGFGGFGNNNRNNKKKNQSATSKKAVYDKVKAAPMFLRSDQEKAWYCEQKEAVWILDLLSGPTWPFTSYSTESKKASHLGPDYSFEEIRWEAYKAVATNSLPQHNQL